MYYTYRIYSKIPVDSKKIFEGSSLILNDKFVGLLSVTSEKIEVTIRIFWWHLEKLEIYGGRIDKCENELINILYPRQLFSVDEYAFIASQDAI